MNYATNGEIEQKKKKKKKKKKEEKHLSWVGFDEALLLNCRCPLVDAELPHMGPPTGSLSEKKNQNVYSGRLGKKFHLETPTI